MRARRSHILKFAVVGSPISHSKSPRMHAAAFRALHFEHEYEALEADDEGLVRIVQALRGGALQGLNVTVPHKVRVLELADRIDASARFVGAANTLVRAADGAIVAYNTDAGALLGELYALLGEREHPLAGKTAIVMGTGGAARAALVACAQAGARRTLVLGRRAAAFAAEAERIFVGAAASPASLATTSIVPQALGAPSSFTMNDVGVIVQATSCGMTAGPDGAVVAEAIDWARLPKSAAVLDVVYAPRETLLLARARAARVAHANGLGMLARQGALAFELWLGVAPPLEVMLGALQP